MVPTQVISRTGLINGVTGNYRDRSVMAGAYTAFVVDESSFVTNARNHPTCTISALAFRAADHIIRASKNRSIKAPSA